MCGIFGYIGSKKDKNAASICIEGLKRLEYRGYDSAGIAGYNSGKILFCKEAGKVSIVEQKLLQDNFTADFAIAHTRWATHGKPTFINAHPHFDSQESMALVHNGIIENYDSLKQMLQSKGVLSGLIPIQKLSCSSSPISMRKIFSQQCDRLSIS